MKTLQEYKVTNPILYALIISVVVLALLSPSLSLAANDDREREDRAEREQRYAYGHYSIPPFIQFFIEFKERYGWLPPSIERLLEHYGYGDDDDDGGEPSDSDPSIIDKDVNPEENSATLSINFDEDVKANLFLSPNENFNKKDDGVLKLKNNKFMSEHEFMVEDLELNTEYFYFVEYRDRDKNKVVSEEMSFTTLSDEDEDSNPELLSHEAVAGETNVDISATFDEAVKARLFVSKDSGFDKNTDDLITKTNNVLMTEHEFAIDELDSNTEYFYRIQYRDSDGKTRLSDEMSFMTEELDDEDDTTNPVLNDTDISKSTTSADLMFDFSEAVQARLFVSTNDGFGTTDGDVIKMTHADYMSEHNFGLTDLLPDTEYFYVVKFRDNDGNDVMTSQMSFTTNPEDSTDTDGPVISSITESIGTSTVTAEWTTDEPATSAVYLSVNSGFALDSDGVMLSEDLTLKTSHSESFTGLASSTDYYYKIVSEDEAGNETMSEERTLSTS